MCKSILGSNASIDIWINESYNPQGVDETLDMLSREAQRPARDAKIERLRNLKTEVETQLEDLRKVNESLEEPVRELTAEQKEARKDLHRASEAERKRPMFSIREVQKDPEAILMCGLPVGIVNAVILIEARHVQRARNAMSARGTLNRPNYCSWKKQLWARVRIRFHCIRKDLRRREQIANGELPKREYYGIGTGQVVGHH